MINWCKKHGTYYSAVDGDPCPKCEAVIAPIRDAPIEYVAAGQDLAKYRDFAAYISLTIVDGVAKIKRIHMWPHVDWPVVMADTATFYAEDHARVIHVDQGDAGDPVISQYRNSMGLNVEGIRFSMPSKAGMVEYARDLMQRTKRKTPPMLVLPTKKSKNPFIQELWAQIAEQERIQGAAETPKFAHPSGRHDDLFWTLLLACNAARPYLTEKAWALRIR